MPASRQDIQRIIALLEQDGELVDELRRVLGLAGGGPDAAGAAPPSSDDASLAGRLAELAAAQARTEKSLQQLTARVDALATAQQRTEERLERLIETVEKLVQEHRETRRQLGGLSATVGYTLENAAYKALPALLLRDHGLEVVEPLRRRFVVGPEDEAYEVNIIGRGRRDGRTLLIVGESKVQLSKNDVDRFVRRKLKPVGDLLGEETFAVLVTHMISAPEVADHAAERSIAVYYSYDF